MEMFTPDENNPGNTDISFDDRVDHVLHHGYQFKLGKYIDDGHAILKKNPWGFMGFIFIYLVAGLFLTIIPSIGQFISLIVGPPLSAGIYLVAHRIAKGKREEFRNFFDGFKFMFPLVLLSLLTYFIMIIIAALYITPILGTEGISNLNQIVFKMQKGPLGPADMNYLLAIANRLIPLFAILMVLVILFSFSMFIVLFGRKSALNALLTSGNIIGRKFFHFLLLYFILLLINILGFLALIVGLFYTSALSACIIYAAFEDIVGTNASDIPE